MQPCIRLRFSTGTQAMLFTLVSRKDSRKDPIPCILHSALHYNYAHALQQPYLEPKPGQEVLMGHPILAACWIINGSNTMRLVGLSTAGIHWVAKEPTHKSMRPILVFLLSPQQSTKTPQSASSGHEHTDCIACKCTPIVGSIFPFWLPSGTKSTFPLSLRPPSRSSIIDAIVIWVQMLRRFWNRRRHGAILFGPIHQYRHICTQASDIYYSLIQKFVARTLFKGLLLVELLPVLFLTIRPLTWFLIIISIVDEILWC